MLWTDRHTDITNIVVTLAGAREPISNNNNKNKTPPHFDVQKIKENKEGSNNLY